MKKVLFATTALTALAVGGTAMADISLFGSARLGLVYDDSLDNELQTNSRVRFGVNMSGETDSGIEFGASLRADQVVDGGIDTGDSGQAGEAFVSGSLGTLSFGDTNGADEQWVGDLNGNLSLTGLGDFNETAFVSNGGNAGDSDTFDFSNNADARPTIRYDYDFAGFGVSLSADSRLSDYGIGAGFSGPVGGFDLEVGLGYYAFQDFTFTSDETTTGIVEVDGIPTEVALVESTTTQVEEGDQFTALLGFGAFGADMNVIYNKLDSDDGSEFETIGVGAEYAFDAVTVGAYYRNVMTGKGELEEVDGDDVYGFSAEYDLGGGAVIAGGITSTYADDTIADFGIDMSF
ncbi:MAG: porin [Pseudomonadota bacterium]